MMCRLGPDYFARNLLIHYNDLRLDMSRTPSAPAKIQPHPKNPRNPRRFYGARLRPPIGETIGEHTAAGAAGPPCDALRCSLTQNPTMVTDRSLPRRIRGLYAIDGKAERISSGVASWQSPGWPSKPGFLRSNHARS
jgi:hypothetical protein